MSIAGSRRSGHTYTTHPGSRPLFPRLCAPTATLWATAPPTIEATGDRTVMMPKRRTTPARAINALKGARADGGPGPVLRKLVGKAAAER